jgi:DNA polymerase-3 subunit beta
MKIHFNPKDFLRQFKIAASIAMGKDVNPAHRNVKIIADKNDGVVLMATDTEFGIRCHVDAVVSKNGEALLPPKQFRQILESAKDGRLTLGSTKNGIIVTGKHDEQWGLDTQSPDEFPDVAEFAETAYHEIPAKVLSEMIRRTIFAIDTEDLRYALGGVCFEHNGSCVTAVATDGRRLAAQDADGIRVNYHEFEPAIFPVNALKLLTKVLKEKSVNDTDNVKMAVHAVADKERRTSGTVHFHCKDVTIFSRLVEGRFPKWRPIVPETADRLHAQVRCETLRTALKRMVTTELQPGVTFTFRHGELTLESRAKESGQSKVTIPVAFNGTAEFIFDITYIRDYLRVLDVDTAIDIYMAVDNDPVLFTIGDGNYRYVVMPMSREKTANAKPEADTGIEVVGQVSTMEEPMNDVDEFPCPDVDTDLQTRFFQLQMEHDQLQAKVEYYKLLLDRAMRAIERMKSEQRVCA